MHRIRRWAALAATALLVTGCQILSFAWNVPANVAAGSVFTMDLAGTTDGASGVVWAVFQVPNGFDVVAAGWSSPPYRGVATVTTNPAALLPYVADPGHHLVAVSGQLQLPNSGTYVDAKVYVRAPVAPGAYTLKMVLAVGTAGALQPQLGFTGFQAAGGAAIRSLQVQPIAPAKPFAIANEGLWQVAQTVSYSGGSAVADVDRDGRCDLLLTFNTTIQVYRSTGAGFVPGATIPAAGTSVQPFLATDLDRDGWVDIVSASGRVTYGVDGSNWIAGPQLPNSLQGTEVATGDFDGDGQADVAIVGNTNALVFRGLGNRTFAPPTTLATSNTFQHWLLAADLDGDGRSELVVGDPLLAGTVQVWRPDPTGTWAVVATVPGRKAGCAIDVDGLPGKELVLSGDANRYHWNGTSLLPVPGQQALLFDRVAVADFDRDGFADLLLSNFQPLALQLWRRDPSTLFTQVPLPAAAGFRVLNLVTPLHAGDFDGDTFPDALAFMDVPLAWHNTNTGAAPYGQGCSAAGQPVPDLQALGAVGAAQPITLQLASSLPGALSFFWVADAAQASPLAPYGAPGCLLLADSSVVVATIAGATGVAALPVTLPPLPSTAQLTWYLQGAIYDPSANALGGRFSGGLALKVQ